MSKNIERCPKDIKKLVNPKTGRCVMESSPIIKKLIYEGYTIIVTPNKNQPIPPGDAPKSKNDDIKIFKVCPSDKNKLVNPTTGRCIMITSPIVKKLMSQGWTIAFNDPGVTPLVIKPKGVINLDKLKKDLDIDTDGIVSINEYLDSLEITTFEETDAKGAFNFLRTNTNIPRFLSLIRKTDPVFKKNLCWFNQKYYVFKDPKGNGPQIKIVEKFTIEDHDSYNYSAFENHAQFYNAPVRGIKKQGVSNFVIHPLLMRYLSSCKERYLAMALSLSTSALASGSYSGGHANVLIFDTKLKTVDRYDPHGSQCGMGACPSYDQDKIDDTLIQEFKKILPSYKFIDFSISCPNLGPQIKAEIFDRTGYCVTWSLMFTVLRILNPDKSQDDLNKQLLEGTRAQIFSKMLRFAKFYSDILKNNQNYLIDTA